MVALGLWLRRVVTMRTYDGIKAERGINLESPEFLERARQLLSKKQTIEIYMSGSTMRPTIEDGDVVMIEGVNDGKISQGDIVLYQSRYDTAVIHRVIRIDRSSTEKSVTTRGDASSQNDPSIPLHQVIGKIKNIERAGEQIKMKKPQPGLWRQFIVFLKRLFSRG